MFFGIIPAPEPKFDEAGEKEFRRYYNDRTISYTRKGLFAGMILALIPLPVLYLHGHDGLAVEVILRLILIPAIFCMIIIVSNKPWFHEWEQHFFFMAFLAPLLTQLYRINFFPVVSDFEFGYFGLVLLIFVFATLIRPLFYWSLLASGSASLAGIVSVLITQESHITTQAISVIFCVTFFAAGAASYFIEISFRKEFAYSSELQKAMEEANRQARTDTLTGMNNRRAFFEYSKPIHEEASRYFHPYSIMLLDIDHFKRINDTYGHSVGDEVITALARTLEQSIRSADIPGRLGGEEFGILLPETPLENAHELAERLRKNAASVTVEVNGEEIGFTISIGLADYDQHSSLECVLADADKALYEAKGTGRNKVAVA